MESGAPLLGLAKYKYYAFKQDRLDRPYLILLQFLQFYYIFAFVSHHF